MVKELHILFYEDVDDVCNTTRGYGRATRYKVNHSLEALGSNCAIALDGDDIC